MTPLMSKAFLFLFKDEEDEVAEARQQDQCQK
jgi:hypothetical protein